MHPKSFPKRLDSKTSCLRITVPENLDLALEGLIRKVLREQPKTDEVYSFAANYFETLLKIRDEAGTKFTAAQLCPFHSDEEAHEMIILAGTFPKPAAKGRRHKEAQIAKNLGIKKKTEKVEQEKNLEKSKGNSFKDVKPDKEKKQATPDLIRKLPVSHEHKPKGKEGTFAKAKDGGLEMDAVREGIDEEEFLKSDPIKELVEKELLTSANSSGKEIRTKGPEPQEEGSSLPMPEKEHSADKPGEVQTQLTTVLKESGNNSPAEKAGFEEELGSETVTTGVGIAEEVSAKQNVDVGRKETPEKVANAAEVEASSEDKTADRPQRESEVRNTVKAIQLKEKEEADRPQTEEKLQKIEPEEVKQTAPEAAEAPPPEVSDAAEKNSQATVAHEMSGGDKTPISTTDEMEGRGVEQNKTSPEPSSREKETEAVGQIEGESEIAVRPSSVPSFEAGEKSAKVANTSEMEHELSLDKRIEKDDVQEKKADVQGRQKVEKEKANDLEKESTVQEGTNGDPSKRKENNSEITAPIVESKVVGEIVENEKGAITPGNEPPHEKRSENSQKGGENGGTEPEDPKKLPVEGQKLISEGAVEAEENAIEELKKPENNAAATGTGDEALDKKAIEPLEVHGQIEEDSGKSTKVIPATEQTSETKTPDGAAEQNNQKQADMEVKTEIENPINARTEGSATAPEEQTEKGTETREETVTPVSGLRTANVKPENEVYENLKMDPSGSAPNLSAYPETLPKGSTAVDAPEMADPESETGRPGAAHEDIPTEDNLPPPPEEELCSVVDVLHLPKENAPVGGRSPDADRAESPPSGKSETDPEGSHDSSGIQTMSSETPSDQSRHNAESEAKEEAAKISEKWPSVTSPQVPLKLEIDKEADVEGGLTADARDLQTQNSTTREGKVASGTGESDPPEGAKHIVIIEEPEQANESPDASLPTGGIQIKTIQTHYYDALRVPEILTREYRVHGVGLPTTVGLVDAFPKLAPSSDVGVPPSFDEADTPSHEEHPQTGILEGEEHLRGHEEEEGASPVQETPMSPPPENLQTTCETFLNNERLFSSSEKEEIRYVVSGAGKTSEPEGANISETAREGDGLPVEAAARETAENSPASATETKKAMSPLAGAAPDSGEGDGTSAEAGKVSHDSTNGKTAEDYPPTVSEAPKEEEAEGKPTNEKIREKRDLETGEAAVEGSSGDSDSTASSGTTEIKRSDSSGRNFSFAARPSSVRSSVLGERNPLERTASLSAHVSDAADVDVWTTIEKELQEAATKIQSKYRGYKTRKKLQREDAVQITTEESSRRVTPVEVEEAEDRRRGTGEFHDVLVLSDHPR